MKAITTSLSVLILAALCPGIALAAPATQSVLVVNTSSAAVPVTLGTAPVNVEVGAKQTQVLFSGIVGTDTTLDVSSCAQIRVTASVPKDGEGTVYLTDDSVPTTAPDLFAAPVIMHLSSLTGPPDASTLLETPGLKLTIGGNGNPSAVVYCR